MDLSHVPRIDLARAKQLHEAGNLRGMFWMSDEDYHHPQCPGVSSTRLKQILRSPAHYQHNLQDPTETEAMIFGRQVHEMLLQPERFSARHVKAEPNPHDWNKERKAYLDWKAARQEELGDKLELSVETWDQIYGIVDAVWAKGSAKQLLDPAQTVAEIACFSVDPDTGILMRSKADIFGGWHITDLKTCQDARPRAFRYDCKRFHYPFSAAFYLDVFNAHSDTTIDSFLWIAAEKKRPHGVWVHAATPGMLDLGRKQYKEALATLKACVEAGVWPCYPDDITALEYESFDLKELYE